MRVVLDFIAKFLYNIERETAAGSTVFGRWMTAFSIVLPFQEGACINMALLSTSNLRKAFGAEDLFSGVSFEIQSGDRIGLVGVNGSGKTTLFKMLTGDLSNDGGEIHLSRDAVIGYMEQHVCNNLEQTAYAEVLSVFAPLLGMERELEEINLALQGKPQNQTELIERQMLLNDRFPARICFCSTSRQTIWTSLPSNGWRIFSKAIPALFWSFRMTVIFWTV